MSEISAHSVNLGLLTLNAKPCLMKTTIVATGVGRSGTTMISRIMAAVGVDLGKNLTPETREDKGLQVAVKADDLDAFAEICGRYNDRRKKWGFKCPPIRSRIAKFDGLMRNPRYIVVFRDLMAIACRSNMAIGEDILQNLRVTALSYVSVIEQLETLKRPALLLSYEKALAHPELTVRAIAEFCGMQLDTARIREIADAEIRGGDSRYEKLPQGRV